MNLKNRLYNSHRTIILFGVMILLGCILSSFVSATRISYWNFSEGTGATSYDSEGRYNGTLINSIAWATGRYDGGLQADGVNDYVNLSRVITETNGVSALTLEAWIVANKSDAGIESILSQANGAGNRNFHLRMNNMFLEFGIYDDGDAETSIQSSSSIATGVWTHVAGVFNGTGVSVYINGIFNGSAAETGPTDTVSGSSYALIGSVDRGTAQYFNGTLDDLMVWDEARTQAQIQTDMMGAAGGLPISLSVTLDNPPSGTSFFSSTISLNSSYTATASNLTNATLYVWNSSGVYNSTEVKFINGTSNSSSFIVSGIGLGSYSWNVWTCAKNASASLCQFSASNNTFTWIPFTVNWQNFNSQVYETSYQTFRLNITTLPTILSVNSKLNYNGTLYLATTTCSGSACAITRSLDIPLTTVDTLNKTSWWELTIYDGTNSYSFNTTGNIIGQIVNKTHLEECNATYTTKSLNFTFYNEKNLSMVSGISVGATFSTWLGTGAIRRTSSFNKATTSNLSLCIQPTATSFFTDATLEYSYEDAIITYIPKNYYMQNATISSATQEIPLYLLDSADSTSFIIHVQDQTLSAVKNALVYIQRYYPVDGTYKTVQIVKTDDNGETVGFYEVETVDYKHLIYLNGTLLLETNPQKVVGKTVPYTLTFTVGEALEYPNIDWKDIDGLTKSLSFNETTNIVSFTYIDETGQVTLSRLVVYKERMDNSSVTIICNTTSNQASATLTCNVTGYDGSISAKAYLNEEVSDIISFVISTAKDIMGNTGLIMGFFIILTAGFAFFWNPTAGLIGINAALWLVSLIGFISFSPIFLFAIAAVSIIAAIILNT